MDCRTSKDFLNICRLCCNDDNKSVTLLEQFTFVSDADENRYEMQLNDVVKFCLDMDLISLDEEFPNNPKFVCAKCVEQLVSIYQFKSLCKRNNDVYFISEPVEYLTEENVDNEDQEMVYADVQIETVYDDPHNDIQSASKQRLNRSLSSVIDKSFASSSSTDSKRQLNNMKNAMRQRLKRENETLEEKELRRKKVAEQTRRRRNQMRQQNPEEYSRILQQVAERKRQKRNTMNFEDKQLLRAREAEAARIRRSQMSYEQKMSMRVKNRDTARQRRAKVGSESYTESAGDDHVWVVEDPEYIEC